MQKQKNFKIKLISMIKIEQIKKIKIVEILKLMSQVLVNQDLVEIQAKVVAIQDKVVEELFAQIYTEQENYLLKIG